MNPLNDRQLEDALHAAGQLEIAPATSSLDLPSKIRSRCRRRKRNRLLGTTATVAALLVFMLWVSFGLKTKIQPTETPRSDIASAIPSDSPGADPRIPRKIERLEEELDRMRTKLADLEKQLEEAKRSFVSSGDPGESLLSADDLMQIEDEKTAFLVLSRAERYLAQTDKAEALKEYRRILENFPRTASAEKAKKQIAQLTAN